MEKFEIEIQIQPPTAKQLTQQKYIILHQMISQEANNLKLGLYRLLNDRIELDYLTNERLLIKFTRTGRHKIDYSTIKNENFRKKIKTVIEDSIPFVF